ncbi:MULTISPECIES: hypothetical protein [Burkholderia]|uniref:Uncharacterized protein n=1 Tax=Burkholderia cepacia TaxID=292 RepID=A0AA88YZK3_BURCE|nr:MULTISPECIES: hypothetical protein [Burkholderia]KGB91774.1 hypothetical protein DM43_1462 [Burkholderia cepacia]KWE55505.1 hypothetical protein WT53_24260 [Burkholderia sp. MSMB2157WGS]
MRNHTTLIESTIDRIDTNLIRIEADIKKVPFYRLTIQDTCYFIAASDVDAEAFKRIDQLKPGMAVRACVFEDRGRRGIAWIRSSDVAIAPYDALAQKQRDVSLLTWTSCMFVLSLAIGAAAFNANWALIGVLAVFVSIVSVLGGLLALAGLSDLILKPQRREAQQKWQYESTGFTVERSST